MSAFAAQKQDDANEREPFAAFLNDEATTEAIAPVVSEAGWNTSRIQGGGVANAVRSLALTPSPELLVVDLSESVDPLGDITALAEVCEPGTVVIALGEVNDINLYRNLVSQGIFDYLVKPVSVDSLRAALAAADSALRASVPEEGPAGDAAVTNSVTTVIGVRGGAGTSTVTIGVSWLLAHEFNCKVALLDLDLMFGTASLVFDLEPGRGLCDALENPNRIDSLFIDRAMVKECDNLSIFSSEAPLADIPHTDPSALAHLVEELRAHFNNVIIDLPRTSVNQHPFLLTDASQVFLVADLTLTSIRDTIRVLAYIRDVAPKAEVKVVVNRASNQSEVTPRDFESAIERKIDWIVPADVRSSIAAAKAAQTLPQAAKASRSSVMLRKIAASLTQGGGETKKLPVWKKLFQGARK
jgi:pilus assembly protein CpaE